MPRRRAALATHLPLKIWGRGWKRPGYERSVVAPCVRNEALGDLYRNSVCTLNDHWSDMARFNYVNNRVFDALACGLPVLSDPHDGLAGLDFGEGIRIREPGQSLDDAVDALLADYESLRAGARRDSGAWLRLELGLGPEGPRLEMSERRVDDAGHLGDGARLELALPRGEVAGRDAAT